MAKKGSCENPNILNRGAWSPEEDKTLINFVQAHGVGNWTRLSKRAGLKRSGKSSRLRWLNYLKPDIKRGNITLDEEDLIIRLHNLLGNRWSLIAGRLPGRTDNEIKNYWNTHLRKKLEKQNHDKIPLNSTEISRKTRVEPKGCTKNSLDINTNIESSNALTNYDSATTMNNVVVSTCLDSHNYQNPFACTPQDSHDNFSTLDLCDNLIMDDFGDEAWWLDDSIGQAWHESWKLT